jgi:steroid delta-isomerase-like uncharacterized protein
MSSGDVVGQIVNAIRQEDAEAFGRLFADNAVMHHPLAPVPLRGRSAIRDGEQALFDAFSDVDIKVKSKLNEGQHYAVEVFLSATNTGSIDLGNGRVVPPTGNRIEVPSAWFFDLGADGLVVAERDYFDTATLMSQLGLES